MSRKKNVVRNYLYGSSSQIITTVVAFIARTIFIQQLGETYLGISGLFSSILSVLSLAELGLGNVIVFSLYKPIAVGDEDKIRTLVSFYKKVYWGISLTVLSIGLVLVPFLPYLINLDESIPHLTLYYLLYVLNSAVSYLYVYKTSVIRADQKQYIITYTSTASSILCHIAQIVFLYATRNFTVYLMFQVFFTFLQNFWASKKADQLYPFLKEKAKKIERHEVKEIVRNTVSMAAYKIGGVILNSTDNMFISTMVSTVTVGYYSNYTMLVGMLKRVVSIIQEAINGSLGNYNAVSDNKQKYVMFQTVSAVFLWIASFLSVGFYVVASEIIMVWVGNSYVMEQRVVFAVALDLFLTSALYPVWTFRNTTGIFKETQNILLYTAAANVILSYILGRVFGVFGILIATSLSRLMTSFWYEPYVLFKKVFGESSFYFFKEIIINIGLSVLSIVVIEKIVSLISSVSGIGMVVLKIVLCTVVANIILGAYHLYKPQVRKILKISLKREG